MLIALIFIVGCSSAVNCDKLEEETKELIDAANYCDDDSDCVISPLSRCPFGCHLLFNKNADTIKIEENLALFNYNCMECMYDCDVSPKEEEIKCINSKCIDTRLSE
jgi:hypothetical protein